MDYVKLLGAIPKVIEVAGKGPLGIFALMIIALAGLAFVFFRGAPVTARIAIFLVLVIGVGLFGVSIASSRNRQSYARAYVRAVAAFDQGQYSVGIDRLNSALAAIDADNTGLTQTELDGWRYYLLTSQSVWRAFAVDETAADFRERTALHLRDAYTHWLRVPRGSLPNQYITESRVNNLVHYLCADPRTRDYVRPEDIEIREEACKRRVVNVDEPVIVATRHLPLPPAALPHADVERDALERQKEYDLRERSFDTERKQSPPPRDRKKGEYPLRDFDREDRGRGR